MQIHELAALGRTPTTGDSLAIDTGGGTVKIDYAALATAILDKLGAGNDDVVDIDHGGTGESTAAAALEALGAAASAELADSYNDNGTYDVGELCIYNNTLYKCTTAIDTAEAWNADHWTATTISEDMVKQSDVVDSLTSTATDKPLSAAQGKALNDKIAVVNKNITLGESFSPGQMKECIFDISDLKQIYSEVYLLNFAGVSGANYGSFQFGYGYLRPNNMYSVGIRNNSTSAQTASTFDVQFLCIK